MEREHDRFSQQWQSGSFWLLVSIHVLFLGWSFQEEKEEKEEERRRSQQGLTLGCVITSVPQSSTKLSRELIFEQSLGNRLLDLIHFSLSFSLLFAQPFAPDLEFQVRFLGVLRGWNFSSREWKFLISQGQGEVVVQRSPSRFSFWFHNHQSYMGRFPLPNLEKV